MLRMQQQFHCYKSARLEAAVEALDNGVPLEDVPIRESAFAYTSQARGKPRGNLTFWQLRDCVWI